MKIIIFNNTDRKVNGWHNWRTEDLENEICDALKETGNHVEFMHLNNLNQFYNDLSDIDLDESIVLSLCEYINDNGRVFVSDILEKLGVPFVGSNYESVLKAIDKDKAKICFVRNGIPTSRFYMISSPEEIGKDYLGYPVVAKPLSAGCSAGISIAKDGKQLEEVVGELLYKFKQPVMVEEYIGDKDCKEYTVCVLYNGDYRVITYTEIIIPIRDGIKLLDEKVKNDPKLDKIGRVEDTVIKKKLRVLALKTVNAINGKDVARVDIRTQGNNLYVIEINLFPGLGNDSYLRRTLQFYDVGFKELINMIVHSAIIRYGMKPSLEMEEMAQYAYKKISGN